MQAHADLTDPTRLLPWEEGRISQQDDKKLGKFRKPILRLLHRDPSMRVTAQQFSDDVQGLFADNQDAQPVQGPSGSMSAEADSSTGQSLRQSSGQPSRPTSNNSPNIAGMGVYNPQTL